MICYKCMREHTGAACPSCGFDAGAYEAIPTALLPMTMLRGRYMLGAVLGKGGFGITYIGYDNINRQKVAVKEFFPSSIAYRDSKQRLEVSVQSDMRRIYDSGVSKFYNEAVTLSQLQDIPATVSIYDFFYENNTAYIVMEFIDGTAIDQIVLRQGPLDIDVTLTIYYPIIEALKAIHAAGILHRDISPSNIMLDESFRSRLIDFGSSRAYSQDMSTDLTVILKKGFAPIEQYTRKGRHGPAEDVYSICASMYYTLTGKVPPAATDRMVFDTLLPFSSFGVDVPAPIAGMILKGMSVRVEDRYPTMAELLEEIQKAVRGDGGEPPDRQKKSERHSRKKRGLDPRLGLLIVSGIVFVLLLIVLFLLL